MDSRQTGNLLWHLRQLLEPQAARDANDAELLRRFAAGRDEAAFAALMQRHARLVWGVCRHVLPHDQDAEDAFQGTFLVLARKANAISKQNSVASWLYGVAYRIAQKARVAASRRRSHESRAASRPETSPSSEMAWRELQAILDEELSRLPDKYRAPFLLCCLESKSKPEAAQELGWKEGTVSSRLDHARKVLQRRLARRGVMLSALLCGTALAREATAMVPPTLASGTLKAALAFAAGRAVESGAAAPAVELAEALLRGLSVSWLKVGLVGLLLFSLAGAGAAWVLRQPPADVRSGEGRPRDRAVADKRKEGETGPRRGVVGKESRGKAPTREGEATMQVAGQVVGPGGRPLAGARVAVVAGEFRQAGARLKEAGSGKQVLKAGQANGRGQFRLALARPVVGRHYGVTLVASAPGYAPSWITIAPREDYRALRFDLQAGHAVRGRLVDVKGTAAGRVQVHVVGLVKRGVGNGGKVVRPQKIKGSDPFSPVAGTQVLRFRRPPAGLDAWPAPVTTDEAGQFLLRDVGPNCEIDLQVDDARFAPQWLVIRTGAGQRKAPVTFTLERGRAVRGTVTCADTGEPMADAPVVVQATGQGASPLPGKVEGKTDKKGRFQVRPFPGQDLVLSAFPARGKPYLVLQKSIRWPRGKRNHEVNLPLAHGVLVSGQVVEASSDRPVTGAAVEYEPRTEDNPHARMETGAPVIDWWSQDASTGADGRFRLTVLPGPGWLLVKGPTADFIHVEVSARQLQAGKVGGTPYFPDAVVPLDLKADAVLRDVLVRLHRGVTVTGKVLDSSGRPVRSAFLLTPTYLPSGSSLRSNFLPMRLPVRGGRFELPGCDTGRSVVVLFIDAANREGARVELSGKQAGKPVVVRLAPCGSATTRLVESAGRTFSGAAVRLDILLRPGADIQDSIDKQVKAGIVVPPQRLCGAPCIGRDGRKGTLTFSCLIPGATYLVAADEGNGMVRKAVFKVRPGQQLVLPDIVLKTAKGTRR
jgi:RNA polymerase sigma factor (sigma-70 family)